MHGPLNVKLFWMHRMQLHSVTLNSPLQFLVPLLGPNCSSLHMENNSFQNTLQTLTG